MPDRIKNWTQALSTGERMQPKQREDMAETLRILTDAANKVYRSGIEPVYNRAKSLELPLDQIFVKDDLDFYNNQNPSPEDKKAKALQWIKDHPNDPRIPKMKKKLGIQ